LTPEVSELDRLSQILQSLLTDGSTVNVEYDTENDGSERTLTIATTRMLTGITEEEEQQPEEETE
jgi:hypothetical protein